MDSQVTCSSTSTLYFKKLYVFLIFFCRIS